MLRRNVCTEEGLVNGAVGSVVGRLLWRNSLALLALPLLFSISVMPFASGRQAVVDGTLDSGGRC